MIPGSCSGTWPRSGTPPAPDPAAAGRRPDVHVQREPEVPVRPPHEAGPAVDRRAASQRRRAVDRAVGTAARHRTDPVPDLRAGTTKSRVTLRLTRARSGRARARVIARANISSTATDWPGA